jgi:hypothetical protein
MILLPVGRASDRALSAWARRTSSRDGLSDTSPRLGARRRHRHEPCVDAGRRTVAAKEAVDKQSQLIDAIRVKPSFHRAEWSLNNDRYRDRGTRNLGQWVQLERDGLLGEVNLAVAVTCRWVVSSAMVRKRPRPW